MDRRIREGGLEAGMSTVPTPGSPEVKARGCLCDGRHIGDVYIEVMECPLHGVHADAQAMDALRNAVMGETPNAILVDWWSKP